MPPFRNYKTNWARPWKPNGRKPGSPPRWSDLVRSRYGEAGCYVLRDVSTKEVLYVGRGTTDLGHVFRRHFNEWGANEKHYPSRYRRFDRDRVEVKFFVVRGEGDLRESVHVLEAKLIARYKPTLNARRERIRLDREPGDDDTGFVEMFHTPERVGRLIAQEVPF